MFVCESEGGRPKKTTEVLNGSVGSKIFERGRTEGEKLCVVRSKTGVVRSDVRPVRGTYIVGSP